MPTGKHGRRRASASPAERAAPKISTTACAPPTAHALPATADQVSDLASLTAVINTLSTSIVVAVSEGKSVTAANKRLIVLAAEESRRAMAAYGRVAAASGSRDISADMRSGNGGDSLRQEILACVREEMAKMKKDFTRAVHTTSTSAAVIAPVSTAPSYAAMARLPANTSMTPATNKPAPPPTPRPAIIVASKTPASTKQAAVEAFRKSISFRQSNYAPIKVVPLSNSKLRVEFDTAQDCEDALQRLSKSGSS
ncbi:protein VASP homolog [Battus philenor]|uniref:protein VASP homolog n=1 Tax=Battus philenor TaxID=42288 RepID=UPI0035D09037